ncbi:MAG TPA: sigma factor, partial [Thermoanaerobaculia bacterium]|nr:sigma factor [Thermoanaerobaculia bacterium]
MSVDEAGSAAGERLAALFERHHLRLWRLARRMAADADEAGDLVQETFLRAARHAARLPAGDGPAEGWLVRTLVNLCRDRGRRLGVRRARREEANVSLAADRVAASGSVAAT